MRQLAASLTFLAARRTTPQAHQHIEPRQAIAPDAKYFPYDTLHPVAIDGPGRHLFAGDDSKPRVSESIQPGKHGEIPARPDRAGSQRCRELIRTPQPRRARKTHPRRPAPAVQTASRARPFARRARSTPRPPRVRIRTRNPCVRLRFAIEGWNVRLVAMTILQRGPRCAADAPLCGVSGRRTVGAAGPHRRSKRAVFCRRLSSRQKARY